LLRIRLPQSSDGYGKTVHGRFNHIGVLTLFVPTLQVPFSGLGVIALQFCRMPSDYDNFPTPFTATLDRRMDIVRLFLEFLFVVVR
jgi:hypothetical protein